MLENGCFPQINQFGDKLKYLFEGQGHKVNFRPDVAFEVDW